MRMSVLQLIMLLLLSDVIHAQPGMSARKYSREALRIDLLYIRYQLFTVHANPYSQLSKKEFEQRFDALEKKLPDSLTAAEFVAQVAPLIAETGDEHARLEVPVTVKGGAAQRTYATERLHYNRYGRTGYLYAGSFGSYSDDDINRYNHMLDSIFSLIRRDSVARLVIDVSHNGGGNSVLGDQIIARFYTRPYRDYSMNWRRSDEYLKMLESWGVKLDTQYVKMRTGDILHYDGDTVRPEAHSDVFGGKVYVMVGDSTFSSAILFGTLVKDNNMATLIGVTPRFGHPTHFGEMYGVTTPILKLNFRFGVKEWIRPAGKGSINALVPDIALNMKEPLDEAAVVAQLPE